MPFHPHLETLESRLALAAATFTVTSLADSGAGSLRQAILDANSSAGEDRIQFAVAGTIRVGDAWAFTTSLDILQAIAQGRGPQRWHMVLGYAGWGAGQLETELGQHGWHIAPPDGACVWDVAADRRWERAFALTGVAVANLSATPGRA
jgi:putative AlgH/UPF0301 family transcriptional regulator